MVSICILNWNRVDTLKKTIRLLENCKIENEIIIFDQNSSDGSIEYLKSLSNNQTYVIFSPVNIGNSLSRNQLVEKSKYNYIVFLDSDIVPIENSIEELYYFMKDNKEFSILGYDYTDHSTDFSKITKSENKILLEDLNLDHRIAFTQYGIFKKDVLKKCPFPSFFPFNEEGWGAEDDIVGLTVADNNLGKIGMILGRTYYHNRNGSSKDQLGYDNYKIRYFNRFIYYRYFQWFLNPKEKLESLKTKKLVTKEVDLYKYFWNAHNNLGDIATDYIFKKFFPFIKFRNDSKNLFFFGGSIFDHIQNAIKERPSININEVIMYGVGISSISEIKVTPNIKYLIYPRGYKTYDLLKKYDIKVEEPVGDVLQLFALLPYRKLNENNNSKVYVRDIYSNSQQPVENAKGIKVGKHSHENFKEKYISLPEFIDLCYSNSHFYSSQIHPFFIPLTLGRGGTLQPKDLRAEDLKFFNQLSFDMSEEDSLLFREEIHNKIINTIEQILTILRKYSDIYY